MPAPSRRLIELTSAESARLISETSILCLPLGSIEQHGPHLPLNTDIVVAEGLTLALAPDLVRRELAAEFDRKRDTIRALILDRGTSWPWRTDDPRLARDGVIGDAAAASAELGAAIIKSVVEEARAVLVRLRENA